jgi:hypothetical protein
MAKLFFFLTFVFFVRSFASTVADCKSVDMRDKFPPIRDQGARIGWCYAFTAADLMNEAAGISPKDPISALDVGTTFISAKKALFESEVLKINSNIPYYSASDGTDARTRLDGVEPKMRSGGWPDLAMTLYLKQNRIFHESEAKSTVQSPSVIPMTLDKQDEILDNREPGQETYIEQVINDRISGVARSEIKQSKSQCFKSEDIGISGNLVGAINDEATLQLKKSLDKSCKKNLKFKSNLKVQIYLDNEKHQYLGMIKGLLKLGHPVGISYDFCGLSKKHRDLYHVFN